MNIDFTGKSVVVTGGGRGLAKDIALKFAQSGGDVWIADIREDNASAAADEIRALGRKSGYSIVDVSDFECMKTFFDQVEKEMGKIDVLVNAAGIMYFKDFLDSEPKGLQKLIDINILGTSYGCQFALQKMIPRKYGKIINIASIAARRGTPTRPHYNMTKAAVVSLTQSAAYTGAPHGVNVNAVCPGIIRTEMWEGILDSLHEKTGRDREEIWQERLNEMIPMGRAQEPQDISYAALFLASDFARNITGQALNVCGGARMN